MNKTIIGTVSILAIASLIGLYIWSSQNRYYIMTTSDGITYEVDKKTGKTWMLYMGKKTPMKEPELITHEKELPYEEQTKVRGNAGIRLGDLDGEIYNGSTWTVTKIIVNVTAKEVDGSIRWSRDFSERLTITPLTTGSFYINMTGATGVEDISWTIKNVFGYKK